MLIVKAKVSGITPLLMHNPKGSMRHKPGATVSGRIPDAIDEAEAGTYRLQDKSLYVPAVAMFNCIIAGASEFKIGKKSLKSRLAGMISGMEPENYIPLLRDGKTMMEYDEIDIQRAVIQGQGIMRARAKINTPWELKFELYFDPIVTDKSMLKIMDQVIDRAGRTVGILDQRPGSPKNKSGRFGKFEIAECEVIDDTEPQVDEKKDKKRK